MEHNGMREITVPYGPFENAVVGIDPVQTHRRRDNELRYISVFFIFVSRLAHAPLATTTIATVNHLAISSSFLLFLSFSPRTKCIFVYYFVYLITVE